MSTPTITPSEAQQVCSSLALPAGLAEVCAVPPGFYGRITLIYEAGSVVRLEAVQSTLVPRSEVVVVVPGANGAAPATLMGVRQGGRRTG